LKRLLVILAALLLPATPILHAEDLPPPRPEATPSLVCFAMEQDAVGAGMTPVQSVVNRMVAGLACAVTGKPSPDQAWRSLVKPGEKVGIRVSTQPGPVGGTHPQVARAVVDQLVAAGIKPSDILVWDRRRQDLAAAGYEGVPGLNLRWVEQGSGFDPRVTVESAAIGQLVYGDFEFKENRTSLADILGPKAQLSNLSHLPVILSREVDKVINIPSLCDSTYTGIHGALAGMTLGILDNWRRFGNGRGYGDAALAEVYADPRIGKKVILTIMDAMVLQYAGGPFPSPVNCVEYGTLIASRDPVAVDATALKLLDEQRLISRLPKASDEGGHVAEAESRGLGNADEKMIKLIRIGNGRDSGSLPRPTRASTPQPVPSYRL
jgi:uncharacterized protein (DUF362 family)